MSFFNNPSWIDPKILAYTNLDEVPQNLITEINEKLNGLVSKQPEVSIVIPVWNEEVNIIRTLYTLVQSKTSASLEVIVINNNSTDRTQEVLDKLHVSSFVEKKQGVGPARQLGQVNREGSCDCWRIYLWIA